MQFKKGVRGECFETYLSLEDNAKEEAKKMMYEMEGWHQLAKDDGNWRTVVDAVAKEEVRQARRRGWGCNGKGGQKSDRDGRMASIS